MLAHFSGADQLMASRHIYTRQFCGYCSRGEVFWKPKGVKFEEHDATFSPDVRQEMIGARTAARLSRRSSSMNAHVGGCDDLHALDRAGKLDAMLAA
jgi:glutaredoxin 3